MAQPAPSPSPEAAFAALPLFGGVPPEIRASFARQGRLHRYRAGTVMFLQDDPPDTVYCVLSGRVEITTTAADGRVRILAIVAPGELLGELAVLGATGRCGSPPEDDNIRAGTDHRRTIERTGPGPADSGGCGTALSAPQSASRSGAPWALLVICFNDDFVRHQYADTAKE